MCPYFSLANIQVQTGEVKIVPQLVGQLSWVHFLCRMPRNKNYATKAKSINDKILAELVQARKAMQPKMTRAALAEALDVEPSTALRMENGQFKLTMERFFELCFILELEPMEVMRKVIK